MHEINVINNVKFLSFVTVRTQGTASLFSGTNLPLIATMVTGNWQNIFSVTLPAVKNILLFCRSAPYKPQAKAPSWRTTVCWSPAAYLLGEVWINLGGSVKRGSGCNFMEDVFVLSK